MKHLLIVAHTPSDNTRALAEAVDRGARSEEIEGVEVRLLAPLDAGPDDVLWADALILGTTENFGYMAGLVKDFFERIYYPCLEKTEALPFALYVRAGLDGTGTVNSIGRIVGGLKWRYVQDPLVAQGKFRDEFVGQCEELGMAVAAGLEAGIF
jgi:multimeric flavodoxin WrbA